MDRETALRILGLDASASPEELEATHRRLVADLDGLVDSAEADTVKAKHRAEKERLDQAATAVRQQPDEPEVNRLTLRQEMDNHSSAGHRFSVDEAVHVGRAICRALDSSGDRLAHGGLNPANVFLRDDGTVKLGAFDPKSPSPTGPAATVGGSGRAIAYIAPEQLTGSTAIDHRADQYSTAAILYEMLTSDVLIGRVKSVGEAVPDIPRPLSQALDRALSAKPSDRFTDLSAFARALAGGAAARRSRRWGRAAAIVILLLVAAGATFPVWEGRVRRVISRAMHDPQAQAVAEAARTQALVAASAWRHVVELLPTELRPDGPGGADEAFSAGDRLFETKGYGKAEEAFRKALDLYESQTAAATALLTNEPSRLGREVRDLLERLDGVEEKLYDRVAEADTHVEGCEKNLDNARTDEERDAMAARLRAAEDELDLLNQLKTLTGANVFSQSLRRQIRSALSEGDRYLETGRRREALSSYAKCRARLEELLTWPERAESALRDRSVLLDEMKRLRSVLGASALELQGVQSAFDAAAARMSLGDEELDAGRVVEALTSFDAAREELSGIRMRAVEGLLVRARTFDDEGKPAAAALALDELLALDPDHLAGRQLRSKIAAYRMTNSIGMELVFIPPGEFNMGSPRDEGGRDDDEGRHRVRIAAGLYMGATEVTQAQWRAVMEDNPSRWPGDDLPVEQVAWEEVLEFCRKLSDKEGRHYRLPTEEEWEYACRAGATTPFSFGETISTEQANFDGDYAYGSGSKGIFRSETVPVRSFPPNAWGLSDMHGNVWEWCPDSRKDYPPSPVRVSADNAPIEGRVLRGGSWRSRPRFCRAANRVRDLEASRLNNVGFRVVMESE